MGGNYILVDGEPKEVDLMTWALWFDGTDDKRRVAWTEFGDVHISTVFLGRDHNWSGGPPLLFETMVFGGKYDQEQERYSTLDEARRGHDRMVALCGPLDTVR